ARVGPGAARRRRQLLLDAGGRLRPRLHRLDGREGLLVRRALREAALVVRDGRLRLLLARDLAPARPRRLLRPLLLRPRRGDRRSPLELPRERPDLGLGDRPRRGRLLLDARRAHVRARRADRPPPLDVPGRQVLTGRLRRPPPLPRRLHAPLRARPGPPSVTGC